MFWGPSNITGKVETSFVIVTGMCVVLLFFVTTMMVLFLLRYNRKRNPVPADIRENIPLEIAWTVVPTMLVLVMFYFGWVNFSYIRNPPKDAMEIGVTGRQWSWSFTYGNGKQSSELYVPIGRPVKLILTSADVVHSFFIPAYRVKEDCVPGMKTHLWFIADQLGTYDIFCTEYCGLAHSHMLSKLNVMEAPDFEKWYEAKAVVTGGKGAEILQAKGCLGCHTTDGTKKTGPTLKGLFGREVEVATNGKERKVVADEDYIRRSVLDPGADVVEGYPNIMPKLPVTPEELDEIVAYIKTLK